MQCQDTQRVNRVVRC